MNALLGRIDVELPAHWTGARPLDAVVDHLGHVGVLLHECVHLAVEGGLAWAGGAAEALG
jgi:hypothetical protein